MNNLQPQPEPEEKIKITDVIPGLGLSIISFFGIHSFHQSNLEELVHLRDQSWKVITIDMVPPYHYKVRKMKHEYFIDLYDSSSEFYSTKCGYKTITLCKAEYPVPSGKIQHIEFYKSSNIGKSRLDEALKIRAIQYKDENQQIQTASLRKDFPNTSKEINKQKWKLGFSTFVSMVFFIFLAYINSIFTAIPKWARDIIYVFLAGNIVFILANTIILFS